MTKQVIIFKNTSHAICSIHCPPDANIEDSIEKVPADAIPFQDGDLYKIITEQFFLDNYRNFIILKENKLAENKNKKEVFIYLPVEYNGKNYINSERASNNLQAAYSFSSFPLNWLDIEDNEVIFTKDDALNLMNLIITQRSSGYYQEAEFNRLINAATTIEELNAININYI